MSVSLNKEPESCSEKIEFQNSQLNPSHNQSARNHSLPTQKYPSINRKTSKRRQIQEEKASILEVFKDLLTIVNLNFSKASQNNSFKNKQYKIPKLSKTASKIKKQESLSHKQPLKKQDQKPVQKQQKKIIIQMVEEKSQKAKEIQERESAMNSVIQNYSVFMKYTINEQEQEDQSVKDVQIVKNLLGFKNFADQEDQEQNNQSSNLKRHLFQDQFQIFNQDDYEQNSFHSENGQPQNQELQGQAKKQSQELRPLQSVQKCSEKIKMVAEEQQPKKE